MQIQANHRYMYICVHTQKKKQYKKHVKLYKYKTHTIKSEMFFGGLNFVFPPFIRKYNKNFFMYIYKEIP